MTVIADREPPDTMPCPVCGADSAVEWVDVTALGDTRRQYMPCCINCPTPNCGYVCKTCRVPIGWIHEAICAPVVLAAHRAGAANPTHVTKEQCR